MKKLSHFIFYVWTWTILAAVFMPSAGAQQKTLDQMRQDAAAHEAREDWKAAETAYLDMTRAYPEDPLAYFLAGRFFTDRRRFKEAVEYLEKGLQKDPESETAHLYLSRIYIELGDMAKSSRHSQKVLQIQEEERKRVTMHQQAFEMAEIAKKEGTP